MVAVELLVPRYRRDTPDGEDLRGGVRAVHEIIVEGVAGVATLARPKVCLVHVGEGGMQHVRDGVRLLPGHWFIILPTYKTLQDRKI